MQSVLRIGAAAGVTIVGGTLVFSGSPVNAATFTVTNLDDSGPGSLRDALTLANAANDVDQIDFDAGLTGTIVLTGGQLTISTPLSIVGPGADVITVSGNDASRVLYRTSAYGISVVTVSGLTLADGAASYGGGLLAFGATALDEVVITGNTVTGNGGGIFFDSPGQDSMITITESVISDNVAGNDGGGMYMEDTNDSVVAATFITGSVFTNNSAGGSGGGLAMYDPDQPLVIADSVFSGNIAGGDGGGIYLYHIDGGYALTIEGSTISGNSAVNDGGGVSVYDAPVIFRNSTVSGNSAGRGGGIATYSVPPTIEHSTVAGNTASGTGGGVFVDSGTATLSHAIIAGNTAPTDADVAGALDASFSLIQVAPTGVFTDSGGNIIGSDPLLGPLQDNGGPTFTRLPATGSPAINAGDPAIATPPATDQRGFARAVGVIDMGAVEVDGGVVSISPLTTTVQETAGSVAITLTRTGTGDGAASVDVGTTDGTATAGSDYTTLVTTVTWASGETGGKVVNVPILTDGALEIDETFLVVLSNAIGVTLGNATSVITITDVVPSTTTTTTTTPTTTTTTTVAAPTTTIVLPPPILVPTLPDTGSTNSGAIALVAGAMVALGGAFSGLARRRGRS